MGIGEFFRKLGSQFKRFWENVFVKNQFVESEEVLPPELQDALKKADKEAAEMENDYGSSSGLNKFRVSTVPTVKKSKEDQEADSKQKDSEVETDVDREYGED